MNIPKIELTPETGGKEENYLSFLEALTDVEDLYDENEDESTESKKYKLKLCLKDKGCNTDLEDFEASDNESDKINLIKHNNPINLNSLDLECGTATESYKTAVCKPNGQKKFKTQQSVVQENHPLLLSPHEMLEDEGKTDVECDYSDNEYETNDLPPEPEFILDNMYKNYEVIDAERVTNNVSTPIIETGCEEEENNGLLKSMSYLSNLSLASNFSNVTDVENLNSDAEEVLSKKCKTKKRRSKSKQIKVVDTDEEDLELSESENKNQHKKLKRHLKVCRKSMPFDSDNEQSDNPRFPVCKNVISKKQKSLMLPQADRDIFTDVEDFEQDNPIPVVDINIDEEAFENKLKDIASSYSNIAECTNMSNNWLMYMADATKEVENEEIPTEEDSCQSENDDVNEINELHNSLNVRFYSTEKKTKNENITQANNLKIPQEEGELLTDLENVESSDENEEMPVAIFNENYISTDEEDLEIINMKTNDFIEEIILPQPTRHLILLAENDSNQPSIKILPLPEHYRSGMSPVKELQTDEEHFSDEVDEDRSSNEQIINLSSYVTDGGSIDITDKLKLDKNVDKLDSKTDTEDLLIEKSSMKRKHPKFKYFKKVNKPQLNLLNVEKKETLPLTDTEELYFSDNSKKNILNIPIGDVIDKQATDVEYLPSSGSDDESERRVMSSTPLHMREMSGEVILNREGGEPIPANDRLMAELKLPFQEKVISSPMYTDTEDMNASTDEEFTSFSPKLINPELDQVYSSNIHVQNTNRFNCDTDADVTYLKGGSYEDFDTEIDEIIMDEHKNEQSVHIDFKQDSVTFGYTVSRELEAQKKKIKLPSHDEEMEKFELHEDQRPTGSKFVTYESVLLTPDRNKSYHLSNSENIQTTTSYAYIDIMLERMLDEVDKQEKMFGLDLDILEPNETCINSLELRPSSDAIIEIPIRSQVQTPKVYQCVREMVINDESDYVDHKEAKNLEDVQINLIDLEDTNKTNELEKISLATANLITSLECDEAKMLLDDEFSINAIDKRKYDMYFVKRASSESLSDNYLDSESDTNEHLIDPDYEPIDNTTPLKYAYQLYDNRTGNDIWWEGTYRNLSIVPEEDEESVSLLGSYSGNYISKPFLTRKSPTRVNNSLLIKETLRSSSSSTSTSSLSSSDEGQYETLEKVVKAEVKLMVKTTDKGKEAIEIRSVREFVENPKKDSGIPVKESKSKSKSQFFPEKISKKINNISNKFSSILESKGKKSSEYVVLQNSNTKKQKRPSAKQRTQKPSFTLPRLFVRTTDQESIKPSKSESDLLNNKELSRSRSELVATPSESYPLQLCPDNFNYLEGPDIEDDKIDLYANRPFYPCYNQYTVKPTLFQKNPFTEFTSNPFTCNSPIPQAYCDWLSEQEDISRGKPTSTTLSLDKNDAAPIEHPVGVVPAGLSSVPSNADNKTILENTNALIESESQQSEQYKSGDESKRTGDKQEPKKKKGILGTLKTFVGKSLDHSDSDSEKSPKKDTEKSSKKDKKKKKKDAKSVPKPTEKIGKPKMSTPTKELPEMDLPPTYQPPDIPLIDNQPINGEQVQIQVTDLDGDLDTVENIKQEATKFVEKVIEDGETVASTIIQKAPKKEKATKITIVDEITKTISPVIIQEEEFSIVIDPTKKESPKKSRDTFTINIDESIEQIEKEIMKKSPILPDEKIVKPVIDPNSPIKSVKDNIYIEIEPIVSEPQAKLIGEPLLIEVTEQLKKVTVDDSKPEIIESQQVDNNIVKEKEKKRKQSRIFGFFTKSGKETDESDDDSRKEIIEKQDKEVKEKSVERSSEDKKGFLGIFKKSKKDTTDESDSIITDVTMSREMVKVLSDTHDFINREIQNYDDGGDIKKRVQLSPKETASSGTIKEDVNIKDSAPETETVETKKTGILGGLFKKSKKDSLENVPERITVEPAETEIVTKHDESTIKTNTDKSSATILQYGLEYRTATDDFLKQEISNYMGILSNKEEGSLNEPPKPEGLLSKFMKKKSVEREAISEDIQKNMVKETNEAKDVEIKDTKHVENIKHDTKDKTQIKTEYIETEKDETITEKPQTSEKSGGFFGIFTKKSKRDKERDDSIEKKTVEEIEHVKEVIDGDNKLHTEISDVKISVGTEKITEIKTQIKVEPKRIQSTISEDVSKLNEEINQKLNTLKKEIEELSIESKVIDKKLETEKFLHQETLKYDHFSTPVELEKEVKDRKSGILGIFSKRRSQERETSEEKALSVDESSDIDGKHYKKDERRKSGSPFRIFGKKKTEEEAKKEELLEEPLVQIVEKQPKDITIEDDKLEVKEEKPEKKKSSHIFSIFSKSESSDETEKVIKLSEEVVKQMEDTKNFLSNEIEKYDDEPRVTEKDADDSDEVKSSGLFGIFSKKDNKESPKVTKKKYKKHKKEKSVDEQHEKVGFIEKISRKLTSSSGSESKDEIDEAADKLKEEIYNENAKFEAEISENIKQSVNAIKANKNELIDSVTTIPEKPIFAEIKDEKSSVINDTSEASNFVSEVMQSFDKHLEDIREKVDEVRHKSTTVINENVEQVKVSISESKETESLRQKVDEKFSSAMKLTEEIAKKLEDKAQSLKDSAASSLDESTEQVTSSLKQSVAEVQKVIDSHVSSTKAEVPELDKGSEKCIDTEKVSILIPDIQVFDETRDLVKDIAEQEIDQIIVMANERIQHRTQELENSKVKADQTDTFSDNIKGTVMQKSCKVIENIETEVTTVLNGEKKEDKTNKIREKSEEKDIGKSKKVEEIKIGKTKQEKGFLSKIGRKISKGDDSKSQIKEGEKPETKEVAAKIDDTIRKGDHIKKEKKSGSGFFGKITEKFTKTGKSDSKEHKESSESVEKQEKKLSIEKDKQKEDDKTLLDTRVDITAKAESKDDIQEIKQKTVDFIDDLKTNYDKEQSLKTKEFSEIKRTFSDYDSKNIPEDGNIRTISEVNMDLSNLPTNVVEDFGKIEKSYVTSPTMKRRSASQKLLTDDRPTITQIVDVNQETETNKQDSYSVSHPEDEKSPTGSVRKPLFHIESEEDDSLDTGSKLLEKRESVQSNILENVTEQVLDELISEFKNNLDESASQIHIVQKEVDTKKTVETLEHYKKEAEEDAVIIEKKLRDLDKALESLEKVDVDINKSITDEKIEKKLKRVERKFERMASEVMDSEMVAAKDEKLTTPEVEEKREHEFQRLISQLSTEEVSDFQKEYSHLWDEQTFSKSDEWDSKTPDSQADVQELPQGEIVYMGPVRLNEGNLVNKAGIEVEVIPIMKSPCASPKPRKKKSHRAKSELGFYRQRNRLDDEHGSLPDLKGSPSKRSLVSTIIQMNPSTFLGSSNESLNDQRMTRSLGSTDSLQRGRIMNAVVNWLQNSSPFGSVDNIDIHSGTSLSDPMDSSIIIFDDDISLIETSEILSHENLYTENISERKDCVENNLKSSNVFKTSENLKDTIPSIETSKGPLTTEPIVSLTTTKAAPQPKPRTVKTPETLPFTHEIEEIKTDKQISPVRDDLLDGEEQADVLDSYSNRKKFWENVSKDSQQTKRMSLQEIHVDKNILAKKRQSVQESSLPPVPKPRQALHTSQSVTDSTDIETRPDIVTTKERTVSFESSTSDSSGLVQTDLTRISESDDTSIHGDKYISEYQACFLPPSEQKPRFKPTETFEKTESVESDVAQKGSSQIIENTGYISDSEDVEHYISDSEIEDRVPQIRERQMSVFAPPVASNRRSIYERSASLPTEDLYQISDRAIKLRKQYYEEQIKKEMIEEQLTSEVEDEPSPERKTLFGISQMKSEEEVQDIQDSEEQFQGTIHRSLSTEKLFEEDAEEGENSKDEKRSVKELTKNFEKQLGNVIAGQKIPVMQKTPMDHQSSNDIKDFMEIVSESLLNETKDIDVENITINSQQSISSDRIADDQLSKPDSMEVHVDKSETEYSEKIAELDQDATDFETKSLDSLNAIEETQRSTYDENIPEITITLSGKQRRISEESDEEIKKEPISKTPLKQSEEHIQDTVWEVSVQSQPEMHFDEVDEIAPKLGRIGKEMSSGSPSGKIQPEREDDLSSSLRDESDLGSEIHQDHSDSLASDKIKSDSFTDIEKIILDSLHQQQVDPDEAKKIASALVGEIESEIQKRESTEPIKVIETISESSKTQMSEYLRHLAETKGLDEREVELVESVLARRQRELARLSRDDTHASSMEITDEDLRYSGTEIDYSNILEQQMDQLKAEKVNDKIDYDKIEQEQANSFDNKTGSVDKIDQKHVKMTSSSEGYESYEDNTPSSFRKETESKTVESVRGENFLNESKNIIFEEDETISESAIDKHDNITTEITISSQAIAEENSSNLNIREEKTESIEAAVNVESKTSEKLNTIVSDKALQENKEINESETELFKISGKSGTVSKMSQNLDDQRTETQVETQNLFDQQYEEQHQLTQQEKRNLKQDEDGSEVETITSLDKKHSVISSNITEVDRVQEKVVSVVSSVQEIDSIENLIGDENIEKMLNKPDAEIQIKTHEFIKRTSSSDSKSSLESGKSPEDQFSTCSSEKKDSDKQKNISCENVVLRRMKADGDTSSSSSNLKPDRKSGVDFEAYSSSGESYYHSFELDSNKSRPCSSDVEGMVAAGSSEYESALTSQELSGRSHITSSEYQTAVSSLSSKESMKSLDSESSGNLASIEVSEVSETLVPSTSDLDGDILDTIDQQMLDDIVPHSEWTTQSLPIRQSTEISDSELLSYQGEVNESMDISEDDLVDNKKGCDVPTKMKRSHEMTFQPEPQILSADSPSQADGQDVEEKFGTSLEDGGSVLSMSVSSTSSLGAVRTVIEVSRADSERHDGSMTISGTSEQLSTEGDFESLPRKDSKSSLERQTPTPIVSSSDIATSTTNIPSIVPIDSVTITTSSIKENGIQSVSTQVTSETQSPVEETLSPIKSEVSEIKRKGHRRQESTSSFKPSMIILPSANRPSEIDATYESDLTESDKYTSSKLSFKEVSNDEKKDVDEKEESYETEADQGIHKDYREGRYLEAESDNEFDFSRPQSHVSVSDSDRERCTSTDDRPDSELVDLALRSSVTDDTDPFERPSTPEPCDETKIDTPELSSEAQASVGELEQDYISSKAKEISSTETRFPREVSTEVLIHKELLEKRDSHGKSSTTSSEKSSFEEAEAEAAFNMVAHISPAHKVKQICPILEDEDAEKHELETRERAQKELEERRSQMRDQSPSFIPDIKVTQHMAPIEDRNFHYPELELEAKERESEAQAQTPQTPASNSSKSSEETDQGREYVLEDVVRSIPEESEPIDDKASESKSEVGTVVEKTLKEDSDKETDSPNSDSFEMLEKPDLMDDFVVIEEVAKEAHELDSEGKSVKIHSKPKRVPKKHDEEVEEYLVKSAPTPLTKMTDIKYYPDGSSSDELGFEFEDSPPQDKQKAAASKKDYGQEYDKELEANKKWIEQQFQGDQAAMIAAGYGYEMEFERGPLEDIKEEDVTDLDTGSSRIGSMGSQKNSGGSLGSVKDSYSSTPEYDVLAGRKYFTRSGEHDDISMSSLQEFENLEQAMSLEMKKLHQGSQDSSSNGSFKSRYLASKSGQGDDISISSLKEFEGLEKACIAAHKIEIKVKEEEAILAQIDEGQESLASESESCETMSSKKQVLESDEEDYEKRMFEIDEIIKQAQTNVERFIDLKEAEKTESLGRGDSIEEVSKVPDLDLDAPVVKSTIKVQWKENDDVMITSTDSLELKQDKPSHDDSTDSLDQKTTAPDIMTTSTDSIELQAQKNAKDTNIMTDSIEMRDEKNNMISSDSLELAQATSSGNNLLLTDSIDEDGSRIGACDCSSSSTGKDFSSSVKEDPIDLHHEVVAEYMAESIVSLDPTSSTATHATCHYETDSVFSGSFTSGGSNTMVSSTDTIDPTYTRETVDVAAAVRKVWFDEADSGQQRFSTEYTEDNFKPYVTEVIEPAEDDEYSHTIHRKVELPPEVRKVTFTGAGASQQLEQFIRDFNEGEDVQESEEVDADGNIHVTKVVQKRFIVKDGSDRPMTNEEIEDYFKQLQQSSSESTSGSTVTSHGVITKTVTDAQGQKTTFTQQFDIPSSQLTKSAAGVDESYLTKTDGASSSSRAQALRKRSLRYDISVDEQAEVDPREHDWRFKLPRHGETDETDETNKTSQRSDSEQKEKGQQGSKQ